MDIKIEINEEIISNEDLDNGIDFVERGNMPVKGSVDCKMVIRNDEIAEPWLERPEIKIKSELEEVSISETVRVSPELIICKNESGTGDKADIKEEDSLASDFWFQDYKQENSASQDTENGKYEQLSPMESKRACKEETSSDDTFFSTFPVGAYLKKKICTAAREQSTECEENTVFHGNNSVENSVKSKRSHNDEKEKSCILTSTSQKSNFVQEENLMHTCILCEKSFSKLSFLIKHYAVHESRKNNNCTKCEKKFTVMRELEKHYLIHERKGMHKCDICNKRFTRRHNFKRHNLIHDSPEK